MRTPRQLLERVRGLERPQRTAVGPSASLVTYGRPRLRVSEITPGAWFVREPARPKRRFRVDEVDEDTWMLTRGRAKKRTVRRIGPSRLPTDLLVDHQAAASNMRLYQQSLLHYLAEEHVAWMLRELEVNCVFDVGANRGQYATRLRKSGYTGRIVSFEPLKHTADELDRLAEADEDWHVVRSALGATDCDADMMVAGGGGQMSSLRSPSDFGTAWHPNLSSDRHETVTVRRLDGLYDELVAGIANPRVYLKLDTQGYELEAFAGAGDRIAEVVGMQSEVACVPIYDDMPRWIEQVSTYEAAGFELTGMYPVTIDRSSLRVIEFDAIMIRPDALQR